MARLLWITREPPHPVDSGSRLYTRGLLSSLARAGETITVLALSDSAEPDPALAASTAGVQWRLAKGRQNSRLRSLFSSLPRVTKRFDVPASRKLLREALRDARYDAVVLDNYSSAWALRKVRRTGLPIVTVAHNYETRLMQDIYAAYRGRGPGRLALWLNVGKTRRVEARLVAASALLVTITESDAAAFGELGARNVITIKPGYDGPRDGRPIDAEVPRTVVLFGSYEWVAKQMNLRAFLRAADARFAEEGVRLDVVGSIPPALRQELEPGLRSVTLRGYVEDPSALLRQARIGVVPEATGGGFKLKILDYIFAGVVVAGLAPAFEGIPDEVRPSLLISHSMDELVEDVCRNIDDLPRLEAMRAGALSAAEGAFDWNDRARAFRQALQGLMASPATKRDEAEA